MCSTLRRMIEISPRLSTILRKYRRNGNELDIRGGDFIQRTIVKYKFTLGGGINSPTNEFLLRMLYGNLESEGEHIDTETKLDIDNDRRRYGINNQTKIELYNADIGLYTDLVYN